MDDRKMAFTEHLRELRTRLRNSIIALIVAVCITFWFAQPMFALLAEPYTRAYHAAGLGDAQMSFASLTEPFWVFFKLAMYAGVFVASPVIFYQLWGFIAPGLYSKEKRIALPFAIFSALFFIGGGMFCYVFVFPVAFKFFLSYANENISRMNDLLGAHVNVNVADPLRVNANIFMEQYLDLTTKMLLGFGLVFEMPLLIFFLSYAGLVTHRGLWKFNKYAIVLSFIIGAILTPGPDVVSQLLMATPMVVLYNLSIVIAFVVTRRKEKAAAFETPVAGDKRDDDGDDSDDAK
jgi:sec-independent protein translocase protein TatC